MNIDKYFSSRRTIRSFSKKTVEPGLIRKMLAEATKAPNTGNMQLYSVITSATDESKQRLAPTHFNQPCVTGCSVLLTFCIDMHRFYRWCAVSDAKPGFENLQMLMAAAIDCSIFAQQFNTIAEMNGLGCCYLGTTAYNAPQIAGILELPDGVIPLISIACGYPAGNSTSAPEQDRLPVDAILHEEKYNLPSDSQIRNYYAGKEARDDNRAFVAENNKATLAQVFTDIRYSKENNELFSRNLAEFLSNYLK